MRRTILDQPENQPRQAPEIDISGFLVFALIATSVILLIITASKLPAPANWRLDFNNTDQTIGQAAFVLTLLCPLSLLATRRWYSAIGDRILLIMLLIGTYSWLNSLGMILALKFWAEPQHADLNRLKLARLPSALVAYIAVHAYFARLYWRYKSQIVS